MTGGVLMVAMAATCGSSPTDPDASSPNQIVISDPAGQLSAYQSLVRTVLQTTLDRVMQVLPTTGVTITVTANPSQAIGGYGVGGFTPDSRTVQLFIDPGFAGLNDVLADRLAPLLAHELHHAVRWRTPGYGNTLLEAMVSEGLADHFSIELLGVPVPPWCLAFSEADNAQWLDAARPLFDSTYSHTMWFFGTSATPPRWTGYTLGYRLVRAYKARNPGSTAVTLVSTPANALRPM